MSYVDVAAATVAPHGKKLQRLQNATGSVVSASSKLTAGKYATIKVGATPVRVLFVVTAGTLTVYSDSELSEVTYDTYPFKTVDNDTDVYPKLLAYRFRAYESVYNAYYRDIRNNPFVVNGRPVYNKWLPNMKGGADSTLYELRQCNWERGF